MNKLMKVGLAAVSAVIVGTGCVSKSLATADSTSEKWEKFKSIKTVPYQPMGFPVIDGIGKEVCLQSDIFVKEVVQPMIEADKEGYTGMVAQFQEDVAAAKKDGKTENDVLQAWVDRYGADNVKKLGLAFKFVRQQQRGKNAMLAIAIKRLPAYVALAQRMPQAVNEVKAGAKDPFKAAKLLAAVSQVAQRVDALVWSANFMKTLSEDQAAETEALQGYVDSFQSKVN
jgi:hypothetical protein